MDRFDAGLLPDYGGGTANWRGCIRSLLDSAHEFYAEQHEAQVERLEAEIDSVNEIAGCPDDQSLVDYVRELQAQLADESPGSPRGRLNVLARYAEEHLGHSPVSARPAEVLVLEEIERLRERSDREHKAWEAIRSGRVRLLPRQGPDGALYEAIGPSVIVTRNDPVAAVLVSLEAEAAGEGE